MDALIKALAEFRAQDPHQALAIGLAIVIGSTAVASLLLALLMGYLKRKKKTGATMFQSILLGIGRPLRAFIYLFGLWAAVTVLMGMEVKKLAEASYIGTALAILVLFSATWTLKRIADESRTFVKAQRARTDGGYDDFSAIEAIHVGSLALIYLSAGLILLGIVGVPPSALAGLGVAGGLGAYALTMANQILISNIFAGFVLYFDRPFGPGDWIITDNGRIEGTVVRIGLRLTMITGFDQRPIYVPNSTFNSTATTNASRMNNRRIKQFIGVRYDDFSKLETIMSDIRTYLGEHPQIDQNRTTLVNLVNGSTNMGSTIEGCFGSSSINFQVYTFTKITNWVRFQNVQDEIMLRIGQIVLDNGAEIAFPTTTLELPDSATGTPSNLKISSTET